MLDRNPNLSEAALKRASGERRDIPSFCPHPDMAMEYSFVKVFYPSQK